MNETELQGIPWDFTDFEGQDVVMIDVGDQVVYLSRSDLEEMLDG